MGYSKAPIEAALQKLKDAHKAQDLAAVDSAMAELNTAFQEIILFEAAARECKRLGAVPLPSAERMQAEMDALTARRAALTAERQKARREEQDYAAVRRDVEEFLSPPRQAPARQKDMELE